MKDELIGDMGPFQKPSQPAVGAQTLLVNGAPVAAEGELITAPHRADQPGARQTT